ncbi:trace amine-associated receptor 9-like [Amphiura filiformis]|uniref:trace amine-associated receptor 9-like n=1 Tax=Amphiura filiformis TaxID=82378 RepID=UPI003B211CB0
MEFRSNNSSLLSNITDDDGFSSLWGTPGAIYRSTLMLLTAILSLSGNALCVWVLPHTKNIPEHNRLFLISLSVADFGIGVGVLMYVAPAIAGQWIYNHGMCVALCCAISIFSGVSKNSLLCLSADRYIAIMKPLQYPMWVTRKRVLFLIGYIWFLDIVIVSVLFTPVLHIGPPIVYRPYAAVCVPNLTDPHFSIQAFCTGLFSFTIPLIIIIFIYFKLYRVTVKQLRFIEARQVYSDEDKKKKKSLRGEGKAIRMFTAVTLTFAIAWMPYAIAIPAVAFANRPLPPNLEFFVYWLALSGSWFDAVTLALMNAGFRKTTRKELENLTLSCGCSKLSSKIAPLEETVNNSSSGGRTLDTNVP